MAAAALEEPAKDAEDAMEEFSEAALKRLFRAQLRGLEVDASGVLRQSSTASRPKPRRRRPRVPHPLRDLRTLDRYERQAFTRRSRALHALTRALSAHGRMQETSP